jgi:hypothetical protein
VGKFVSCDVGLTKVLNYISSLFPEDVSDSVNMDEVSGSNISLVKEKSVPRLELTDFSNEILLKVLSYVPTHDLLLNLARVSRNFYHLSKDPNLHRVITLWNKESPSDSNYYDAVVSYLNKTNKTEEFRLVSRCQFHQRFYVRIFSTYIDSAAFL